MVESKIKVKLIGVTQPIIETIPDAEGIISYCARVSNPQNQTSFDTSAKLLNYCIKHKHWSVFETVNAVMEIQVPRDIGRQILRHNSNRFQEFSQRYAEAQEFCFREARLQDDKNRQNSIITDDDDLKKEWLYRQEILLEQVKAHYKWALEQGIAKECARVILPEGLTMSTMYMNGTVRSWIHYCELREANGTQEEHIEVAKKCREELKSHFPSIFTE